MIVEDITYDIGALPDAATVDHNYGYDVDGVDRLRFRGVPRRSRSRLSAARASTAMRRPLTTPCLHASGGLLTAAPAGTYNYAGGSTSALSFMVNGLLDFGDDDGIQGFVGGGVGVARVKASSYALNTLRQRSSTIRTPCSPGRASPASARRSPTMSMSSLKYRFFNADNVKLVDVAGRAVRRPLPVAQHPGWPDVQLRRAAASAAAAAAAASAAAAAPAAASASAARCGCSPGPFIVFFEWDKSDITPEAASILDNAITPVPELRQRAGHAGRPRRPFGFGQLQRRPVAASRGLGEGLYGRPLDPRRRDLDRSVRRKPPARRRPPMASARCRTAAWKSPTVRVRAM